MKPTAFCLVLCVLTLPAMLAAQTTTAPADLQNPNLSPTPHAARANREALTQYKQRGEAPPLKPFSRIGVSAGISVGGINLQAATNVNRFLNVRGVGNVFTYNLNNQTFGDYTVTGTLTLASAGASVDFYPFPHHGLRISPGALFYNNNGATTNVTVAGGTKLDLDNSSGYSDTYYSSTANPITGTASIGLHKQNPAFSITTGWGNLIPRKGGHWSFPFELGVAFTGAPQLGMALTGGAVCSTLASTCYAVNSNASLAAQMQTDLQSQITKYQNQMNPYPFYPIASFGIGYNFRVR